MVRAAALWFGMFALAWTSRAEAEQPTSVTCASTGPRVACKAYTASGVVLQRTTSTVACTYGVTWGYQAGEIWVQDGCAGEFIIGRPDDAATAAAEDAENKSGDKGTKGEGSVPSEQMWGSIDPGRGFLVGRTKYGELSISGYALIRFMDQMPELQEYQDHLGRTRIVDTRLDLYAHRVMVHLKGWLGLPKLRYQLSFWTVNTTDQDALFAVLGYQFHRKFSLYGGMNGLPGSRTLFGSHPYWLGHDRVMADEYFRPYFTYGVWATGEALPGLWYSAMVGNNLSALGITAGQLTREFAYAASVWWMPTTHEFGPNGGFDDYEWHEELATRFGISATTSREDPFNESTSKLPENTTMRFADAVNVFETGSLAPDVTLLQVRYTLLSLDAGIKYKGIFVGAAYFQRWLNDFVADGALPVDRVVDKGFYVQAAFYPVKQQLELYGATSWVFGDKDAGYETQHEYLGGANWFFASSRDIRLNAQLIRVNRSPVSSTFGYYVGGQKGMTASLALSVQF